MTVPPDSEPDPLPTFAAVGGRGITRFYTPRVMGILFLLWAYLCTLFVGVMAPAILTRDTLKLVLSVPLLTLLLLVCSIYWVYRASDEYIRHRILKCAALTGVILAFSTLGYYCLERLGYPHLSMIVVNLYGWTIFTVLMLWVLYRAK
ncbi:MAG TPA: hypothetical protein VK696_04345 [Steroidobacteraceae bacterium]|jgi:hypothetical protein|nr:hypothetical protein [Steroidobacteraceae bacterium]